MTLLQMIFKKRAALPPEPSRSGAISLGRIRATAEKYYRDGDYYCSEAIVKTIRDEFKLEIGDDAIAMASGFPVGVGGSECICGAVVGGCMCLGMVFGRTRAKDKSVTRMMALAKELHDLFRARNKVLCCRILIKGMKQGSREHMRQCIRFTGEVAVDTASIMAREMNLQILE